MESLRLPGFDALEKRERGTAAEGKMTPTQTFMSLNRNHGQLANPNFQWVRGELHVAEKTIGPPGRAWNIVRRAVRPE